MAKRKKSSTKKKNPSVKSTISPKSNAKNSSKTDKKQPKQQPKNKTQQVQKSRYNLYIIIGVVICIIILVIICVCNNIKNNKLKKQLIACENTTITLEEIAPHYLFLGDSITAQYDVMKYFPGYSVVNSGIGGNTTDDILENMYERVYRYNPSTVFLMIGTNDVNHGKSSEEVFDNIKKIINLIQSNLPQARIFIESITPSRGDWGETDNNEKREDINNLLKNEYKDSEVVYIDLYSIVKEKNSNKIQNKYTKDGLHLNEAAYEQISKELKKHMVNIEEKDAKK